MARFRSGPVHGFTLIELLVVVGALVLFIAMLFPALSKAQRTARTVTCLSNVSQLFLGYQAYFNQNCEHAPARDLSGKTFWLDALRPNLSAVNGILLCPEASAPSYGWGSDNLAWGPYDSAHGSPVSISFIGNDSSSYGFNGWVYGKSGVDESDEGIPVFVDATWIEAYPLSTDSILDDTTNVHDDSGLTRFYIARHGRSVNAAFLDGHAEQLPLDVLTHKTWSTPGSSQPTENLLR